MNGRSNHPPEHLVIVERVGEDLVAHGFVSRTLAHSERRVPHTTVLIVPVFDGSNEVLIHRRGARVIGAGKWDFAGGHVNFTPGALQGASGLLGWIEATALREAREEIWISVNGKPFIIGEGAVFRRTRPGELEADEPMNLEFSTGFTVQLPATADVVMADEGCDGAVEILETRRIAAPALEAWFQRQPDDFADGAARILSRGLLGGWLNLSSERSLPAGSG